MIGYGKFWWVWVWERVSMDLWWIIGDVQNSKNIILDTRDQLVYAWQQTLVTLTRKLCDGAVAGSPSDTVGNLGLKERVHLMFPWALLCLHIHQKWRTTQSSKAHNRRAARTPVVQCARCPCGEHLVEAKLLSSSFPGRQFPSPCLKERRIYQEKKKELSMCIIDFGR